MNLKYWKNRLKERGIRYFLLDVKEKITEKRIQKFFFHNKLTSEQKELINHFFYYSYLKKRYSNWLKKQSVDLSFNEPNITKIVWWCWLQGEENAPLICKHCLASIRNYLPDYEVKVITKDNMLSFVNIPDNILEKFHKGLISNTHFSDILRTCLLFEHGGVWIDSTVLLTDNIQNLLEYPLFYFKNYDRGNEAILSSNWFLSSSKNHPIIKLLRDFLFLYWEENNGIIHYYFFHFLLKILSDQFPIYNENVPTYSNIPPHILQKEQFNIYNQERFEQIKQISKVHKLERRVDISKHKIQNTFLEHILNYKF